MLFTGKASVKDLSGPVGIGSMMSDVIDEAQESGGTKNAILSIISFMILVSANLGVMNLLPIPPLDGGKIVIEVIQLVIRRPLSKRVQNAVSYVGLAFFLFLFVFALKNDLVRLLL
jgi:regulator of sigma E protease